MRLEFNKSKIFEALSNLPAHQQLVFGAMCCERMLPSYEAFMGDENWGEIEPLRRALDAVWDACEGTLPGEAQLRDMILQCERCAPDSDNHTSIYTAPAQDAAFAICALLDFLREGDVNHIVRVPRFSIDSVDLIVQERECMDPLDPLRERKIVEHALMQQELVRQRRDLAEAQNISAGDRGALRALRTKLRRESSLTLTS